MAVVRSVAVVALILLHAEVPQRGVKAGEKGPEKPVSRILFGSCIREDRPIPIFRSILRKRPELFIFLGDNIYADTTEMDVMRAKYEKLRVAPGFSSLLESCPVLATWDDHDYGANDAGAEYPKKIDSERIFLGFWKEPADSPRRKRPGVYDARVFGPEGKRVQVILLDTRYFRGPLATGEREVGGPYVPNRDPNVTMLGAAQWKWLERQLRVPAEVRIIASSIQFLSEFSHAESWANLPHEKERLLRLTKTTNANGVIFISGDRHWAELSVKTDNMPYPIYDLTSSALNQIHPRGTPTPNVYRALPTTCHQENFGGITIDWSQDDPEIALQLFDIDGQGTVERRIRLSDLIP
jgi:alkaline phosphatase D